MKFKFEIVDYIAKENTPFQDDPDVSEDSDSCCDSLFANLVQLFLLNVVGFADDVPQAVFVTTF